MNEDFTDVSVLLFIAAVAIALVAAFVVALVLFSYGKLWLQAFVSNAHVSMLSLIGMSLRQVHARTIVEAKIMAMQAGVGTDPDTGITTRRLEAHYLAGGNVPRVIHALIAAHRADIDLDFDRAAAIDLAGRDVLDAVRTSVYPKVIDCPDPEKSGRTTLSAVAKNGVELLVRARVTVRTNLAQLIGGATEETIIARVGEGIITSIGSAKDHLEVMENPDRISKAVLERGLDAHTAFEIVSIDIADIDVGENIGARLQADQAEADTRKAQALAEKRRANAIAREQEMKAAGGAEPGRRCSWPRRKCRGDGRCVPQRESRTAVAERRAEVRVARESIASRRRIAKAVDFDASQASPRLEHGPTLQPGLHSPISDEQRGEERFHERMLDRDPCAAIVAAAAEHQPAEHRCVVVPAELMIALRAARPREHDPLVRAQPVPDDIQKAADAPAQAAEPDDREPPQRGGEAVVERVGGNGE